MPIRPSGRLPVARYVEYATDDARVTLEFLKLAAARGALIANDAQAQGVAYDAARRLRAVQVADRVDGGRFEVATRTVVNAAGPWVDGLREADGSLDHRRLHLSKGVHVVLAHNRLPLRGAIYFERRDGRLLFAVPRGAVTYVGTTATAYAGDPASPLVDAADVAYLLDAARAMFRAADLGQGGATAAGLRPLLQQERRSTTETSRLDEVLVSPSGLVSIAGGKLTGHRRMAERVVDRVLVEQGAGARPCLTATTTLTGGETGGPAGFERHLAAWTGTRARRWLPPGDAAAITARYRSNTARVLSHRIQAGGGADAATIPYAMHEETSTLFSGARGRCPSSPSASRHALRSPWSRWRTPTAGRGALGAGRGLLGSDGGRCAGNGRGQVKYSTVAAGKCAATRRRRSPSMSPCRSFG